MEKGSPIHTFLESKPRPHEYSITDGTGHDRITPPTASGMAAAAANSAKVPGSSEVYSPSAVNAPGSAAIAVRLGIAAATACALPLLSFASKCRSAWPSTFPRVRMRDTVSAGEIVISTAAGSIVATGSIRTSIVNRSFAVPPSWSTAVNSAVYKPAAA